MTKNLFTILGLSAILLAGACEPENETQKIKEPEPVAYSIELPPSYGQSSPDAEFADIDGDGDLDYIITQQDRYSRTNRTRSYIFENDGEGYFKLRPSLAPIKVE